MAAAHAPEGTLALRAAMQNRDLAAAVAAFAPDAVVRSPFTDALTFRGTEQITAVMGVVLQVFPDLSYTDEIRSGSTAVLVARARVGGQDIELVDHLHLGPDGRITELTVFMRPLPAATEALRLIGAGLVRRRSAVRATVIGTLATPQALLSRVGDVVGARLVRAAL